MILKHFNPSDEEFIKTILHSNSLRDAMASQGLNDGTNHYIYFRKRISDLKIDCSHWTIGRKQKATFIYDKNPSKCFYCAENLCYNKRKYKFCSQSCTASFNNRGVDRTTWNKIKPKPSMCLLCGNPTSSLKRKYCSKICYTDFNYQTKVISWLNGTLVCEEEDIPGFIRRYMIEKADYKCTECQWSKKNIYTSKIPLDVHHLDGISTNNVISNLQVLCKCCHALTKNYGSLNRGKGRKKRSKN